MAERIGKLGTGKDKRRMREGWISSGDMVGKSERLEASWPKHPLGTQPVSDAPEHGVTKTPTLLGITLTH